MFSDILVNIQMCTGTTYGVLHVARVELRETLNIESLRDACCHQVMQHDNKFVIHEARLRRCANGRVSLFH